MVRPREVRIIRRSAMSANNGSTASGQTPHHPRHLQRRVRRFAAAIVGSAQAAHLRVFFFFKDEHGVDDGDLVLNLDLRQGVRHAPPNVLGVACLALENDTQAEEGGIERRAGVLSVDPSIDPATEHQAPLVTDHRREGLSPLPASTPTAAPERLHSRITSTIAGRCRGKIPGGFPRFAPK